MTAYARYSSFIEAYMTIVRIVGIAVLSVAALMLVRAYKPELALPVSIAAGLTLLFLVLDGVTGIRSFIDGVVQRYGLDSEYIKVMFKVIGIAYLAQFASQLCRDSGEGAVAAKVELAGRILIITVSLPAVAAVLELISSLMESA